VPDLNWLGILNKVQLEGDLLVFDILKPLQNVPKAAFQPMVYIL
jgi:hypothetical protein